MNRRNENDMEGMVDTVMSPTNSSVSSRGDAGVADVVDLEDVDDDLEASTNSKRKRLNDDEESDQESRSPKAALARKSPSSRDKASNRTNSDDDEDNKRSDDDRTNERGNNTETTDEEDVEKKDVDDDEDEDEADYVEEDDDDKSSRKEERSGRGGGDSEGPTTPRFETPNADVIREPPPVIMYYCAIQGCRSVDEFECLNKIEEGAYGVVYRAKDKKTNEIVALKRLKMEKEKEGFPITSLREVDILLKMQHPNIVTVREIVVGNNMDKIYMAMDYVEHDLKSLMQHGMKKPFMTSEVKTLMQQLLSGIAHLHDNWVIHRDLKTSNLLLSHKGILKIADFGLAREYGSPLKEYTPVVVTLWYRSPELLLNTKKYSTAIDMWSVGCIFGELMLMKPLFNGKNEKDQLDKIFKDLGTPNDRVWPAFKDLPLAKSLNFPNFPYNTLKSRFGNYLSVKGFELINKLLTYDPDRRIGAEEALRSEYFKETPLPVDPSMFPTWPAKSEGLAKPKLEKDSEPRAPSAGKLYEQLVADEGFVLRAPVLSGFNPK